MSNQHFVDVINLYIDKFDTKNIILFNTENIKL